MGIIKNFDSLATSEERKKVLRIVEAGLEAIQPNMALSKSFTLTETTLHIQEQEVDLKNFARVFLLGFGKGAAGISKFIENTLGGYLTEGYVIDVVDVSFAGIHYTRGTHPLPSATNIRFTRNVLDKLQGLTERDLVLVVVCGGGSAIFEAPYRISLETLIELNKALLRSGATIAEINIIRKHLSTVKGGGLARALYPATVKCLVFSDVPGNDLSVIASGPMVKDPTTLADVKTVLEKYSLATAVNLSPHDFTETWREDKYFTKVTNTVMVSNLTALRAMEKKAHAFGIPSVVYSDRLQGDAKQVGMMLIEQTQPGQLLLAGGETTVKVTGAGLGGRNQTLVLAALPFLNDATIIASLDSDGVDFHHFAGAIGDRQTVMNAEKLGIDRQRCLDDDDSYEFFALAGDGIFTGALDSNVADIMMVYKK